MEGSSRKVIHIDMDAFYASVAQRDDPALRGRPVAVGGSRRGGVVMAASYEARTFGVRSAMPAREAVGLCPDLIFVRPRFDVYCAISDQMRAVISRYSVLVEPHGLDEAYLDVTSPLTGPPSATILARQIRADIKKETGLTASAGAGPTKFVAKVASAISKPDGLLVVRPEEVQEFVARLPVRRFWGVGAVTAARLQAAGFETGRDLREAGEETLRRLLGRFGRFLYRLACGDDPRTVQPTRRRKSVGRQRTFIPYLRGVDACQEALAAISSELARRMDRHRLAGQRIMLRVRDDRYVTTSRQITPVTPVWDADDLRAITFLLLHSHRDFVSRPVRLLGVSISALKDRHQLDGFQLRLPFPENH